MSKRALSRYLIAMLVIAVCATAVYGGFAVVASVPFEIGHTSAQISSLVLKDVTAGNALVAIATSCTPKLPATTSTSCSPMNANAGHLYNLIVGILNNGPVQIPTVFVNGLAVATYPQVTLTAGSYSTIDTLITTLVDTTASTNGLKTNGIWYYTFAFTVPADAISGGTVQLTITVYG